jgi:hypothetical protein
MSIKERPILFAGSMVRALLAGAKTQTRRQLRVQPPAATRSFCTYHCPDPRPHHWAFDGGSLLDFAVPCPFGQPGDRLWVRETWTRYDAWQGYHYAADHAGFGIGPDDDPDHVPEHALRWKPSIHMPRAASRITLEVTGVRVERLQDVSRGDAMAEGCPFPNMRVGADPRKWYEALWEALNGAGTWEANPWVWVVEFKRITP